MAEQLLPLPGQTEDYHSYVKHEFELDGCKCQVVEPHNPRPGKLWCWKAEYFLAFPEFELEMLKRGFYLCFMQVEYECGSPRSLAHWDKFYAFLTAQFGFNAKPLLFGLSVGGLYIYNWATKNPDKVSCILGDNPVCDFKSWPGGKGIGKGAPEFWEKLMPAYGFANEDEAMAWQWNPVDNLKPLIEAKIPLIHAAATDDDVVPITENSDVLAQNCAALGGTLVLFRHPGAHHPHFGVGDFKLLCDTVEAATLAHLE